MTIHESEDLSVLSEEMREISNEIAVMKREKNRMADGPEKEQMIINIKDKQFQALFYLEKMENIAKGTFVENR